MSSINTKISTELLDHVIKHFGNFRAILKLTGQQSKIHKKNKQKEQPINTGLLRRSIQP